MEFHSYTLCLSFLFLTTLTVDSNGMSTIGFVEGISGDNQYKSCASFVVPGSMPLPTTADDAEYYPLRNLARVPGCDMPINNSAEHHDQALPLNSSVVAVTYSNCSAVAAALIVQNLGGKGLILIASSMFTMPPSVERMRNHGVYIPTAVIASNSFEKIQDLGQGIRVKEYIPTPKFYMDYSVVLLWLMAVGSVVLGTFWDEYIHLPLNGGPEGDVNYEVNDKGGSDDTRNGTQLQVKDGINGDVVEGKKSVAAEKNKQLGFTLIKIVVILIIITAIQVLLYYFYEEAIYGVFAFFFLITVSSITGLLGTFKFLLPCLAYEISCRKRSIELRQVFMFFVAVGMYVTWVVLRLERFSWALQDILVLCVIVRAVGHVHISDLKTYSVVLILVTLYFTFMIFGTSSMTPEGKSLMEVAILGRDAPDTAQVREKMPMALRLPQLTANPLSTCFYRESSISLLDVFVPGGMISYSYKFGCKVGGRAVYFFVSLLGYGLGLALTFIVQYATRHSQPALLYMTPCILIMVIVLSIARKEFIEIWNGEVQAKNVDSERGKYDQVAQTETNI